MLRIFAVEKLNNCRHPSSFSQGFPQNVWWLKLENLNKIKPMMLKKLWKEAGVCQPAATQNDVIVNDPTQSLIVKIVPT